MILAQVQQTVATVDSTVIKNSGLFKQIDPVGIGMALIGILVVFVALILLYFIFMNVSKVLNISIKRTLRKEGKEDEIKEDNSIPAEVNAAIAMAIHLLYSEAHDKESAVLTINKISRTYSPWSSKIYGLRQYPR
ncbi:MAG: OadG family protein [Ignavibacteria bacterium]|nr:OadG family protein [Ignavibacteria bacterium]